MKRAIKLAAPLLAALILSACGGDAKEPPQSYVLEENSLPSFNALVALEDGVEFEQTAGEEGGTAYRYTQLSDAGKVVEEYTQALETDYDCIIAADSDSSSAPDYSADSGQVLAAQELEDSDQVFLLTIQWEENACTITASLAEQDVLPQQEEQSMTLAQAVELIRRTPLSVLGLSGESMDDYLVIPLEGTVFLDGMPCILVNIYLAENHKFEQSYLIDVANMQLYRADPETKKAVLLN